FDHPWRGPVTVYRGTCGVDAVEASKGLSWSRSREVACWFAFRAAYCRGKPAIVIMKTVDDADIILYDNSRSEEEIILASDPLHMVEPDRKSWGDAHNRHADTLNKSWPKLD